MMTIYNELPTEQKDLIEETLDFFWSQIDAAGLPRKNDDRVCVLAESMAAYLVESRRL